MQLMPYCPYPVGGIFITLDSGNPASVWAGTTWEALGGRTLIGANATYAAGTTGGESSHTLTVDEIPSHKHQVPAHGHGFTQPTVPAHNHGLNGHTHTYAKPNTPTGSTNLVELNIPQTFWHANTLSGDNLNAIIGGGNSYGCRANADKPTAANGHTHTIGTTSTNTGGNSGNTANKAAFACTGGAVSDKAAFDTGNAGGGSSFSILNPYLAVYMWKRVA